MRAHDFVNFIPCKLAGIVYKVINMERYKQADATMKRTTNVVKYVWATFL